MKQLKELRKRQKITQKDLATALNLDPSSISKYESDSASPSPEVLLKISSYFNVSIDYLLQNESSVNNSDDGLTERDNRDIAKDLDNIMEKLSRGEDGPASYNGKELDPEAAELFKEELKIALKRLKLINKEKYTPKKYKSDKK